MDLKDFIVLTPNKGRLNQYTLRISEDGRIQLNSQLTRALRASGENQAEIRISRDLNVIRINPDGGTKLNIPKSGRLKNDALAALLKNRKKNFPLYFEVEWDDQEKIWVGKTAIVGKCPP